MTTTKILKAVESSFLGASWQYCHVHFARAVLESIPKKDKKEIAEKLKAASDEEMKMQAYSKAYWKRIRTTNFIERSNGQQELKRRSRSVGAFPK